MDHGMKREGKVYGSRANKEMGGMGMMPEDKDMKKALKPRMGKAMGGGAGSQPSYGSGEMPKAMPN